MKRLLIAVAILAVFSAEAQTKRRGDAPAKGAPETLGPIAWVKMTEPMESLSISLVEDPEMVDMSCRSTNYLPRACLYRHFSRCRIITKEHPEKLGPKIWNELMMMCKGFFPEPVLLKRKFSDPAYLPNQAAPSVDPEWQFQQSAEITERARAAIKEEERRKMFDR